MVTQPKGLEICWSEEVYNADMCFAEPLEANREPRRDTESTSSAGSSPLPSSAVPATSTSSPLITTLAPSDETTVAARTLTTTVPFLPSSAATAATQPATDSSNGALNSSVIVGLSAGISITFVVLIAGAAIFVKRRRQ
ncbi:uncharacterized protein M421DRAFT_6565 [Didymella exigua CBS 183.55]|uniref:Uncharacterized protein n=1 Tax=Didymella exigua CBS 183.55 TaxID=1150837 RepID=A0A6A5RIT4_9PLEO|nr:uncharacterized protein M421DRAFT_6565 [Didymella exigua CBS 183.55]KAF1927008.1 hypothetical protein M421DRAFT_6565 [Didymella exigua CBS 183.55]